MQSTSAFVSTNKGALPCRNHGDPPLVLFSASIAMTGVLWVQTNTGESRIGSHQWINKIENKSDEKQLSDRGGG